MLIILPVECNESEFSYVLLNKTLLSWKIPHHCCIMTLLDVFDLGVFGKNMEKKFF